MTQYMVNYVCAKTVPDSIKLRLMKGPKIKIPQGNMHGVNLQLIGFDIIMCLSRIEIVSHIF